MSWHETTGPAVRPTPKCCRCGDSGEVHDDASGAWVPCPDCRPVTTAVRPPIVASPIYDR
jgi:hypothetical protein